MIKILEDAIEQFASLPGIGKKNATRLALHILKQPKSNVEKFGSAIVNLRNEIKYCECCNMISEDDTCEICRSSRRDVSTICVVESVRDVMSIEATREYKGLYFVLGGVISPMDGIGPDDLPITKLYQMAAKDEVKELILVINSGMEGETTSYYIFKLLSNLNKTVSTLARGVGFGDELEYTDQITLARSIKMRQPFNP